MAVVRIRAIPSSLSPHSLRRRVFHSGRARAEISPAAGKKRSLALVKRRTRSNSEFNLEAYSQISEEKRIRISEHFPVMLGEILQVFSERNLHSFVDCTVGAGGHSSAIIRAHPELQLYVGLDVDPMALEMARKVIGANVGESSLEVQLRHGNFRSLKCILGGVTDYSFRGAVDGILMDLGMSSMQVNNPMRGFSALNDGPLDMRMNPQATLKAEDILNSWPEAEVGRILREYGEESNWRSLLKKIMSARFSGGLHSTTDLTDLVRSNSPKSYGRQGWIKTATRVFQALRIAVNDELKALEDALHDSFECLSSGGRLAVISFHSLEDRIVKQTFLKIIENGDGTKNVEGEISEAWIKARVVGSRGVVLTKRPITPTEEEEKVNVRCRSAKLRVIQKI